MREICIVEPYDSGHRMAYAMHVAAALADTGVTILTSRGSMRSPYLRLAATEGATVAIREFPPTPKGVLGSLKMLRAFRSAVAETDPDLVFIPYLDYLTPALAFCRRPFGSTPYLGITMRPGRLSSRASAFRSLKRWCHAKVLASCSRRKTCHGVMAIDDVLAAEVDGITYIPDPPLLVDEMPLREDARSKLSLHPDDFTVLVFGTISGRKAVDGLLRAIKAAPAASRFVALIAGRIAPDVRDFIENEQGSPQTVVLDRYLSDEELAEALSAADAVWACYRDHLGMSGVVVQAAASNLPIIACSEGAIGSLARRYNLGPIADPDDVDAVVAALQEVRDRCWASTQGRQEFVESRSIARFRAVVRSLSRPSRA